MLKETEYHVVNCGAYESEYRNRGLVYDVVQHSVFEVDPLAREILDRWAGHSDEEIVAALSGKYSGEEIRETLSELEQVLAPKSQLKDEPNVPPAITRMKLHVCHDCNMRCRYCYAWAKDGDEFYHREDRERMPPEVGFAAVDRVMNNYANGPLPLLTFHGGEPTLNFPLIKQVVEYAETKTSASGKRIRFSIATNGTAFTKEIADFCSRRKVNLCISLDGDEAGNSMRVLKNGNPAFPLVTENIKRYREAGCVVTTEATVHHRNLNVVKAAKLARELGALHILYNLNRDYQSEHSLSEIDVWQLMREFDDLVRWEFSSRPISPAANGSHPTFVRNLGAYYRALANKERHYYFCVYGANSVSVAPNGDVYVCELYVGNRQYALGNLLEKGEAIGNPVDYVRSLSVSSRDPCRSCWARYICGGPCAYESILLFGDPARVAPRYCDLYRSTIETVIAAYALCG